MKLLDFSGRATSLGSGDLNSGIQACTAGTHIAILLALGLDFWMSLSR